MLESDTLDPFVAGLDYPMYIVTTVNTWSGMRAGCLVGFASQCSIEPDHFAVWLSQHNHTHRVALEADIIAVHRPSADQLGLASLFGTHTGDQTDKFARCGWRAGPSGVPILDECPRWFAGDILDRMVGGNHTCFLLKPFASSGLPEGPPSLMFSHVKGLQAAHRA